MTVMMPHFILCEQEPTVNSKFCSNNIKFGSLQCYLNNTGILCYVVKSEEFSLLSLESNFTNMKLFKS